MHPHRTAVTQPLAGHFACLRILTCSHLADKQLCVQRCMGTNQLAPAALARSLRAAPGAFFDEGGRRFFSHPTSKPLHDQFGKMALGAMFVVLVVGIQHEYPRWLQWASLPPLHGTRGAALVA